MSLRLCIANRRVGIKSRRKVLFQTISGMVFQIRPKRADVFLHDICERLGIVILTT